VCDDSHVANPPGERATAQLALIAEIGELLGARGIDWWLFGGWAIDFHAGEITREHADIEMLVTTADAAAAREALVGAGFLAPPPLHPNEGQPYLKAGEEVGCWYLEPNAEGSLATPGRWSDWPYADGAFGDPPRTLHGVTARVMSAPALFDMKLNFRHHAHGAPPRDKDLADIALLERLLAQGRQRS
jgi:hypothetical protein